MLSFFGSCVALAMYGLFAAGNFAMSCLVGKPKTSVKKPGPAEAWLKAGEFSTAAAMGAESATTTPHQRGIVDVAEIYSTNTGTRLHLTPQCPYVRDRKKVTSFKLCQHCARHGTVLAKSVMVPEALLAMRRGG